MQLELKSTQQEQEKALLVSVDTGDYDAEASLSELYELAESAGAQAAADITQRLEKTDAGSCVGSGKLEEISEFCKTNDITLIIFDRELTPTQIRNIEQATGVHTIDRTMLILDIFALRAKTKEGRLQVELAQLKYMLPRLTGKGVQLSRLGGGIGTRGPGETKLETDRRHIRRRMETLKEQLHDVEQRREQLRNRRKKDGVITAAIVGYTNAGKSTLMNTLTQAGVLAEDKLFATLDPTSRALKLPNGVSIMLIDTVGLVRRLPHHLVEAFKSTLEEAAFADIILIFCDAISEEAPLHLQVTRELLTSLGCTDTPIIPVLNKCDLIESNDEIVQIGSAVRISAKDGWGIDNLLTAMEENLPVRVKKVKLLIPFDKTRILAQIRKSSTLLSEEYEPGGTPVTAIVDNYMWGVIKPYIIEE